METNPWFKAGEDFVVEHSLPLVQKKVSELHNPSSPHCPEKAAEPRL
jgi:hypothetical protein